MSTMGFGTTAALLSKSSAVRNQGKPEGHMKDTQAPRRTTPRRRAIKEENFYRPPPASIRREPTNGKSKVSNMPPPANDALHTNEASTEPSQSMMDSTCSVHETGAPSRALECGPKQSGVSSANKIQCVAPTKKQASVLGATDTASEMTSSDDMRPATLLPSDTRSLLCNDILGDADDGDESQSSQGTSIDTATFWSPTKKRCMTGDALAEYVLAAPIDSEMERIVFSENVQLPPERNASLFFVDIDDIRSPTPFPPEPAPGHGTSHVMRSTAAATPARSNSLPGMRRPGRTDSFQTPRALSAVTPGKVDQVRRRFILTGDDSDAGKPPAESTLPNYLSKPVASTMVTGIQSGHQAPSRTTSLWSAPVASERPQRSLRQYSENHALRRGAPDPVLSSIKTTLSSRHPTAPVARAASSGSRSDQTVKTHSGSPASSSSACPPILFFGTKTRNNLLDDDEEDDQGAAERNISSALKSVVSDSVAMRLLSTLDIPPPPPLHMCRSASLCNDDIDLLLGLVDDTASPPGFARRQSSSQIAAN